MDRFIKFHGLMLYVVADPFTNEVEAASHFLGTPLTFGRRMLSGR